MESNCMMYPQELINSLWNCTDEAALTNTKVVDALTNSGPASIIWIPREIPIFA